jgi:hypothetical protein
MAAESGGDVMPFDFMPHIFPRQHKHGQSVSGVQSS